MPLQIERIRGLCFDIDGTLSDTDDAYVQNFARWLRIIRLLYLTHDEQRLARRLVMAFEAPGNLLLGFSDRIGLDSVLARWSDFWIKRKRRPMELKFILMPGVRELLIELHPHYPLAVVSSRSELTTRAFLDQYLLTDFFKVIVTAQTVRYTKPFPDPILYAARQMNISPAECLMIGDTTMDILAGKAAGAQTVGVLCGFGEAGELQRAGADLILQDTHELAGVLSHIVTVPNKTEN